MNKYEQIAKADKGKPKLSLVPTAFIYATARVREYGNKKYPGDPDNWKTVEPSRYRDAAFRHLLAYIDDPQGVDEESKLPHLWHLACNVAFLCEMEAELAKKIDTCYGCMGASFNDCEDCTRVEHKDVLDITEFGFEE